MIAAKWLARQQAQSEQPTACLFETAVCRARPVALAALMLPAPALLVRGSSPGCQRVVPLRGSVFVVPRLSQFEQVLSYLKTGGASTSFREPDFRSSIDF